MKIRLFIFFNLLFSLNLSSQNISLTDLITISGKTNWEEADRILTSKGFEYYDSQKGSTTEYNTVTWSYNKSQYDDKAEAWFYLFTYEGLPSKASYLVFNKRSFSQINNVISNSGFKLTNSNIEDNTVNSTYENSKFIIDVSYEKRKENEYSDRSHTAYNFVVIKKSGIYDPDNGNKIKYFDNGNIEFEYTLKNGKINGKVKSYYENGTLKLDGNYIDGIANGYFVEFDEFGNKSRTYYKKNDEIDGKSILYENNKISEEEEYLQGLKNGKACYYYYNDEEKLFLKVTGEYANSMKHGEWITILIRNNTEEKIEFKKYKYNELEGPFQEIKGDSVISGIYKNGKLEGHFSIHLNLKRSLFNYLEADTNKLIKKENGQYINGKKSGHWKYYSYGNLSKEGNYLNDQEHGIWKAYYIETYNDTNKGSYVHINIQNNNSERVGPLIREIEFSYGEKNGVAKEYYSIVEYKKPCNLDRSDTCIFSQLEKINLLCYYKNDLLDGPYLYKDSMDRIIEKGEFKNNLKEGVWEEYNFEFGEKTHIISHYNKDQLEGEILYKDSLEQLFKKGYYKNGLRIGKWQEFNNSILTREYVYNSDGELNGECIYYNELGKPIKILRFISGKIKQVEIFDKQGFNLKQKLELLDEDNSSYHCKLTEITPAVSISQVFFVNKETDEDIHNLSFDFWFLMSISPKDDNNILGYPDGEYEERDYNGKVTMSGTYYKDKKIKKWTTYINNLRIEQEYIDGKGGIETFYDNSTNELYNKKFVLKYPNGNKKWEIKLEDGLRNGKSKYFNEEGELIKTEKYENGVLISID